MPQNDPWVKARGAPASDGVRSMLDAFEILPAQKLVRVVYRHHPTFAEWKAMMQAVLADPRYVEGFHFLFDKRSAGAAANNTYVEEAVLFYQRHAARMGRWAILVDGPLAFGMARMTASQCGDGVRAFTRLSDAEAWLELRLGTEPTGLTTDA